MRIHRPLPALCAALSLLVVGSGALAQHSGLPGSTRASVPHSSGIGRMMAPHGQIVGNKRTKVYHLPGDKGSLPAPKNSVYFRTERDAIAAGYHAAGAPRGGRMGAGGMRGTGGVPMHRPGAGHGSMGGHGKMGGIH